MGKLYASFKENVDKSIIWSICHRGGNERGATTTTTEMMPRQHSGSGNSIEIPMQKRSVRMWNMLEMVGWSRLSGSHVSVAWQKRGTASDNSITVQTRAPHTTHAFGPRVIVSGLYLWSVHFRSGSSSERCRGSRRSRDVVEVVVHVFLSNQRRR